MYRNVYRNLNDLVRELVYRNLMAYGRAGPFQTEYCLVNGGDVWQMKT